jgi:DNA-binding Lrp family transcriptional regulator
MRSKPNKQSEPYFARRNRLHRFFFIEPKSNANADELAESLIKLPTVQEVYLTDGDYGFVVKTRFINGKEPHDITRYIASHISPKFGRVTSYYQYRKN